MNRVKVMECIRASHGISRPEIARATGLSPSSVTNIVSYLLERDYVLEKGPTDSGDVGRRAIILEFNTRRMPILVIHIERDTATAAVTDLGGEPLLQICEPITSDCGVERLSEVLNLLISRLTLKAKAAGIGPFAAAGIALSGLIKGDDTIALSKTLRLRDVNIYHIVRAFENIPVFLQNSSQTKAISVIRAMDGVPCRSMIFLDLEDGIGLIDIHDGEINRFIAGELGHTTVNKNGGPCFCGNSGCLEAECSVERIFSECSQLMSSGGAPVLSSLLLDKREADGSAQLTLEMIDEAARGGDISVLAVLKGIGEYLGIGIANAINLFCPQKIIINGGTLLKSDYLYRTAIAEAKRRAYAELVDGVKFDIVHVTLQDAIRGIGLYVCGRLFDINGPTL
ncbi:MAG: ROK family transcriptional regulator [Clostridia bacterium]|nr:ROK family transcriptional regulator [Clostridia bacterium]